MTDYQTDRAEPPASRAEERLAFVVLAVFAAPAISATAIAGYGFVVWMIQILSGPPGY